MGTYIDDERQRPRPLSPRPAGLAASAPPAASHQLNGYTTRFSPLAPCSWGVYGQSILIGRCDRTLGSMWGGLFRRTRAKAMG
jgi:hypothetical protein